MSDEGTAVGRGVTDIEIASAVETILRETNGFTSPSDVVKQLEAVLAVDLGHKSSFISAQIHRFFLLQSQGHNFVTHQQKPLFPFPKNPNFHPASPPPSPANFTAHQPSEDLNNLPSPSQKQSQSQSRPMFPPTAMVVKAPAVTTSVNSTKTTSKNSAPSVKRKRGGPGGLNKLCGISPELQTIVGKPALSRTEIVKQLWDYIRKTNLQDPNNRRKILCNNELRLVLETDCTDMFKMNKLLAIHITPLEPTKQIEWTFKKTQVNEESVSRNDDPVPIVVISEPLANLFGCEEREMSQAEVLRQIWEYIKVNQLEDPLNSISIRCDAKLQAILGCESISALGIPETLAQRHLSRKS